MMTKVNKILFAETLNKYYYPYQNWYFQLKKHSKEIISFDVRFNYFKYGKDEMNRMFLELIEKEKPDMIFFWVRNDEFYLNTLLKIKEISPNTKTIIYLGDDDAAFETFSRYYVLFLDYAMVAQRKYLQEYKKDKLNNIVFSIGFDADYFKPIKLKKEYDVTFIGHPKTRESDRYEFLKFLKEKGVNLVLFGWGWDNYPEFKDIYKGPLDSEEMVKVLNKSKINLCFSKNHFGVPHIKAKLFEGDACKSFVLTEYCDEYPHLFKVNKEIVMFKDREDLLNKINYYLKNEKEREKIAQAAYSKVVKKYSVGADLDKLFRLIKKDSSKKKKFPDINKKAISLSIKELKKEKSYLLEKVKDFDYIYFNSRNSQDLEFREYLQIYSLEKTNKQISCSNYYVYSKYLKDYLYFIADSAINNLSKENFNKFLNLEQLMIKKSFFIDNLDSLKLVAEGKSIDFVNKETTAFIALPLLRLYKIKSASYDIMINAFNFIFLFQLLSIKMRKAFFSIYPLALLSKALFGNSFIIKAVIKNLRDKDKKNKIKVFSN